ncbi:hypothetical protein FB451DRAFT_1178025 [Mycena latifolia]|nr:hypothetical protein FB451DRAFT_1178025 [Mycena latifolia]
MHLVHPIELYATYDPAPQQDEPCDLRDRSGRKAHLDIVPTRMTEYLGIAEYCVVADIRVHIVRISGSPDISSRTRPDRPISQRCLGFERFQPGTVVPVPLHNISEFLRERSWPRRSGTRSMYALADRIEDHLDLGVYIYQGAGHDLCHSLILLPHGCPYLRDPDIVKAQRNEGLVLKPPAAVNSQDISALFSLLAADTVERKLFSETKSVHPEEETSAHSVLTLPQF